MLYLSLSFFLNFKGGDFDAQTPRSVNIGLLYNKTGLQLVSKPVEQILGFFQKGFYSKRGAKM